MITRDFVKPGATVIDVGMNKVTERAEFDRLFAGNAKREETFRTKGSTLVGDVIPMWRKWPEPSLRCRAAWAR